MKRMGTQLGTGIVAAATGLLLILSAFSDNSLMLSLREFLLNWAVLTAAIILLISIVRFLLNKLRDLNSTSDNPLNSAACLAAFFTVLIFGITKGFSHTLFQQALYQIQWSIESSLAGLICVALLCGVYRFAQTNAGPLKSSFALSAAFFLLYYSGMLDKLLKTEPGTSVLRVLKAIPLGGVYGLLLGIAIGALVSGICMLFAGSNPFGRSKE